MSQIFHLLGRKETLAICYSSLHYSITPVIAF
jgi:hypothetical protein